VPPYSIPWLKRMKPDLFRPDPSALLDLLRERRVQPLIARRLPLSGARLAHEVLGEGGIAGRLARG